MADLEIGESFESVPLRNDKNFPGGDRVEDLAPYCDVLVLVAKETEFRFVSRQFQEYCNTKLTNEYNAELNRLKIPLSAWKLPSLMPGSADPIRVGLHCCSEMGNIGSALNTVFAVTRYKPSLIIFCGIAGAMDTRKFRIGDVVFPKRITAHLPRWLDSFTEDYDTLPMLSKVNKLKAVGGEFFLDPSEATVSQRAREYWKLLDSSALSNLLMSKPLPENWKNEYNTPDRDASVVDIEAAFCWEMVLDNSKYNQYLRSRIGAAWTTIDIESYGFLRALEMLRQIDGDGPYKLDGLVIRSVSDYCQNIEGTTYHNLWREMALDNMAIATRFLIQTCFR